MRVILVAAIAGLSLISAASARSVAVAPGDTLSSIALKELGSGNRWPELCELNKATLANCDVLPVGAAILVTPEEPAPAAETDAPAPAPADIEAAPPPPAEEEGVTEQRPADIAADEPEATTERVNLVAEPGNFAGTYWGGYFVKPDLVPGQPDPTGGTEATRIEPADTANGAFSGLFRAEALQPGTYTVGVWLRAVDGPLKVRYGITDAYLAREMELGPDWQYAQAVIEVEAPTDRLFEVYEFAKNNPAWEIYGVSVERGEFDTPFYPAP